MEVIHIQPHQDMPSALQSLSPRSREALAIYSKMMNTAGNDKYARLVAKDENKVLGVIGYGVVKLNDVKAGYIMGLVVNDQDSNGEQMRKLLLEHVIHVLRDNGCYNITAPLNPKAPETAALEQFYTNAGFSGFSTGGIYFYRILLNS